MLALESVSVPLLSVGANKGALGVEVRSKLHKPILVDNHHLPHVLLLCHHLQGAHGKNLGSDILSLATCAWLRGRSSDYLELRTSWL